MNRKHPLSPRPLLTAVPFLISLLLGGVCFAQSTVITFNVTTLRDTQDVKPGDGNCQDENGQCSIRASVMEAMEQSNRNRNLIFVARLPAGNYGFSIMGTNENESRTGDLNFQGDLNFSFEGESQQGTVINLNGVDRFARLEQSASLALRNLTIKNGVSQESGGAIQVSSSHSKLTAEQVTFSRNQSNENGGGITARSSAVMLRNVAFEQNKALDSGGGLYLNEGNAQLAHVTFSGNSAAYGGGVLNKGTLNARNLRFEANTASVSGGGLYDSGYGLVLQDSVFIGNVAQSSAGGAYVTKGTLEHLLFQKNRSVQKGGGAYIDGRYPVTFLQSSLVSNAARDGGGLYVEDGATLENLTFSGNTASNQGGSVYFWKKQSSLSSSTLVQGLSLQGTVFVNEATVVLKNSIIHAARGSACEFLKNGRILSGSFNLVNDATCHLQGEGNLERTDPQLAPLQDIGGWPVHLPLLDSPALNAVDPALCPLKDQRDVERPQAGNCDIGAVEVSPEEVKNLATSGKAMEPGVLPDFRLELGFYDAMVGLYINDQKISSENLYSGNFALGALLRPGVNTLRYTIDYDGRDTFGFGMKLFFGDQMLFRHFCVYGMACFNQASKHSTTLHDQELQVMLTPDMKVQVDDHLAEVALTKLRGGYWKYRGGSDTTILTAQPHMDIGETALILQKTYDYTYDLTPDDARCVLQLTRLPNLGDALMFNGKAVAGKLCNEGPYQIRYLPEKDQMLVIPFDSSIHFGEAVFDRQIDPPTIESFTATPTQGTLPLKVKANFKVQNPSGVPMECEVQVTPEQRYRTDCQVSTLEFPLEKAGTYDVQLSVLYNNTLVSRQVRVTAQEKPVQPKTESSSVKQLGLPSGASPDSMIKMQFDPQGRPVVAFTRNRQVFLSRWNGQAWQPLGNALPAPSRSDLDLWISSLVFDARGLPVLATYERGRECGPCATLNLQVRRWDGKTWQVLGKVSAATVVDLFVDPQGKLYLLGNGTVMDEQNGLQVKVRVWDGRQWLQLGTLPRGSTGTLLFQQNGRPLLVLEQFPTDLLPNNPYRTTLQQWEGAKWTEVKNSLLPVKEVQMGALRVMDRKFNPLYVYSPSDPSAGSNQGTFARRWNGKAWESLGLLAETGLVYALLFDEANRPVAILSGRDANTVRLLVAGNWRTVGNMGGSAWFIAGKRLMALDAGQQGLELQSLNLP